MKNKLNGWKISLLIQGAIIASIFSFLPFDIYQKFEINNIWFFILVPLAMFIFTPIWAKVKKKKDNHYLLKRNSFFLLFFLTTLMLMNFWSNWTGLKYLYPLNLFLIGTFLGGMVPFTMEIMRSYAHINKIQLRPSIFLGLGGIITLLIPFLLTYFIPIVQIQNIALIIYFSAIALGNIISLFCNTNIKQGDLTFKINKSSWKTIWKNKSFLSYVYSSGILASLNEIIGYIVPLLVFNDKKIAIIIIGFIYLIRKISYLLGYFIQQKPERSQNTIFWIILASLLGSMILLGGIIIDFNSITINNNHWYITIGLTFSQIIMSFGLGILSANQKKHILQYVSYNDLSLAMMFEHVFGHAIMSFIISAIVYPLIIYYPNPEQMWIIICTLFTMLILVALVLVSILKIKLKVQKKIS